MEPTPGKPPSETIWAHDDELLSEAEAFYAELAKKLGSSDWPALAERLASPSAAASLGSDAVAAACRASDRGFQLAAPLLLMIPRLGIQSGLLDITIDDALAPVFPKRFLDDEQAASLRRALAPPPKASANEIVAPTGGSFYSREAPHLPPLVSEGDHFEAGQPLFVIEVMKMFNKVLAPVRRDAEEEPDARCGRRRRPRRPGDLRDRPRRGDRRGVGGGAQQATQACDARGPGALNAHRLPPACSMECFISDRKAGFRFTVSI